MAAEKKTNDDKALDAALSEIAKQFGDEAITRMDAKPRRVPSLPTGALALDIALGIGGIPQGRLVEIFGPESSGKTTLCYHVIAEVQKAGGRAAFIDTEHAMDAAYAQKVGVQVEDLIVSQPETGEEALSIARLLTQSGAVKLVVIDSVAALTPRAELEGDIGQSSVGQLARLMSQSCRMLRGEANKNGTTLLFTNQIREKIGVTFGSPETQPGGRALKFYSSQRLDIRRIETLKDKDGAHGNRVRVKVVKNKVAPPFQEAEFNITYGLGVDRYATLIDMAIEPDIGMVTKSGSFFKFPSGDNAQGMEKAKAYLRENPELADEIETKIREVRLVSDEVGSDEEPVEGDLEETVETE